MSRPSAGFGTAQSNSFMKDMKRPQYPPPEKFPKHTVNNQTFGSSVGITFSSEMTGNVAESQAELEVLKAILNREGYLARLHDMARTVQRKFKPEIADVMDFVRTTTLDVVDCIVKWREAKGDHNAAFMWNGVNYLLKIPSDLDYLHDYVAIRRWMGFQLTRNPFCVPAPLEHGANQFSAQLLDPKHIDIDTTAATDGFTIGGITRTTLKKNYLPKKKPDVALGNYVAVNKSSMMLNTDNDQTMTMTTTGVDNLSSPPRPGTGIGGGVRSRPGTTSTQTQTQRGVAFDLDGGGAATGTSTSNDARPKSSQSRGQKETISTTAAGGGGGGNSSRSGVSPYYDEVAYYEMANRVGTMSDSIATARGPGTSAAQSFIPNQEMVKLREAELVILKEEEYYGKQGRDPQGRIVPQVTAKTRKVAIEMCKDDRRPISEPAHTITHAPYAAAATDIGMIPEPWTPDAYDAANDPFSRSSDLIDKVDKDAGKWLKGRDKVGGLLAPIEVRGAESRVRKPMRPNLAGELEFKRHREKLTIADRLREISELRAKVAAERKALLDHERTATSSSAAAGSSTYRRGGGSRTGRSATATAVAAATAVGGGVDTTVAINSSRSLANHYHDPLLSSRGGGTADSNNGTDNIISSSRSSVAGCVGGGVLSPLGAAAGGGGGGGVALKNSKPPMSPPPNNKLEPIHNNRSAGSKLQQQQQQQQQQQSSSSSVEEKRSSPSRSLPPGLSLEATRGVVSFHGESEEEQKDRADALKHTEDELQRLAKTEATEQAKLAHVKKYDANINALKQYERTQSTTEKARELERKRRFLSKQEGRRTGPPPPEQANLYDYYATKIQALVRGFLSRQWSVFYEENCDGSAIQFQRIIRGFLGRCRVDKIKGEKRGAMEMQRIFRGKQARSHSMNIAAGQKLGGCAVVIQRIWRGVLAKKRMINKRSLDVAAKRALESVDARNVFVSDVKELSKRIRSAIDEPHKTEFPPDEVLHLIRICVLVIQALHGTLGVSEYTFINTRRHEEVDGNELTWLQASKLLARSERFLRLIRVTAFGPSAKPPRLVQLPTNANLLYYAHMKNPRWTLETFETMGVGTRLCTQLFKWLTAMVEVAQRQREFLSFISHNFPDWLPKLHDLQQTARLQEFTIEYNKATVKVINDLKNRITDDQFLYMLLETDVQRFEADSAAKKSALRDSLAAQNDLKDSQENREKYALAAMDLKLQTMSDELTALTKRYQLLLKRYSEGEAEHVAQELTDLRLQIIVQKVSVADKASQFKVLESQCERNSKRRGDKSSLPGDIRLHAAAAGEARGLEKISSAKAKVFLKTAGVKSSHVLPRELQDRYVVLELSEKGCATQARKLLTVADAARAKFDEDVHLATVDEEASEMQFKTQFVPSDQELQEERTEDEIEAKRERAAIIQYVPDELLYPSSLKRKMRPTVIALSRDLPAYTKVKIHQEVTRLMAGKFVTLDAELNCGLDQAAVQQILDSDKFVIMSVDPGLTRVTRNTFMRNFEMTVNSLYPVPTVSLAQGDEMNKRLPTREVEFGVHPTDIRIMRDGEIKLAMETLAFIADEFLSTDIFHRMMALAVSQLPPQQSMILVLEALLVLQSQDDVFFSPEQSTAAVSWRVTSQMIADPIQLAAILKSMQRGQYSVQRIECLRQYVQHRYWPDPNSTMRRKDPFLHLAASYIEKWIIREQLTLEKGGTPLSVLTRNTMKGIQTVITVADGLDPDDLEISAGSGRVDTGWRMPAVRLVRAALQDVRVLKTVSKIDGVMFNVTVYRDPDTIYFDVYDPASSRIYMTTVPAEEVPMMLMPNAYSRAIGNVPEPPKTEKEIYMRLVKMLRIEKTSHKRNAQKGLVCRRDFAHLASYTRKLCGYTVQLKCYEASLGQLFFTAFVFEYSALLSVLVTEEVRHALIKDCDDSLERENIEHEDCRKLMSQIMDRLKLQPKRIMVDEVLAMRFADCNRRVPVDPVNLKLTQGFKMIVRTRGGAGRPLLNKVINILDVPHIMTIKSFTATKLLRVELYEPRAQTRLEVRLPRFMRKILLGTDNDYVRSWYHKIIKRLRVTWRRKPQLTLDTIVRQAVRKVDGRRVMLQLSLLDVDNILVTLLDPEISTEFTAVVPRAGAVLLLQYQPPSDIFTQQLGVTPESTKPSVRNILQGMQTAQVSADVAAVAGEIDPVFTDNPIEEIFATEGNIKKLFDTLQVVLKRVDRATFFKGYYCTVPIAVSMPPILKDSLIIENDYSLRRSPRLQPGERGGNAERVIATRKQAVPVFMELALNDLARAKSSKAMALHESDRRAADVLTDFLATVERQENIGSVLDAIQVATEDVTEDIVDAVMSKQISRLEERMFPGTKLARYKLLVRSGDADGDEGAMLEVDSDTFNDEEREILSKTERLIYEFGAKTNFRDARAEWQSHVAIKVYEIPCWTPATGIGRRLRFVVYEPKTAKIYEGHIRNSKHLQEVLGLHGQDLLPDQKTTEMLIFIARRRLYLTKINRLREALSQLDDTAGEATEIGDYKIDFESDRLYTADKITPVNVSGDDDKLANKQKLFAAEKMRGMKIVRIARRVSGQLLQLTVFEVPPDIMDDLAALAKPGTTNAAAGAAGAAAGGTRKKMTSPLKSVNNNDDDRKLVHVTKHSAPTLRVVGYDPRTRRKLVCIAPADAITEISGGIYSPYLNPEKRRELAKMLCEALLLVFPRGKPFELLVPWSGADPEAMSAAVMGGGKGAWRTAEESSKKRAGKFFRAGLRVGKLDLVVTAYSPVIGGSSGVQDGNSLQKEMMDLPITLNFYSNGTSQTCDVVVTKQQQVERIGHTITSVADGAPRAAAVRRFCKFFTAEHKDTNGKVTLVVELLPPDKGFLVDYQNVGLPDPGEDTKPVGVPAPFIPLDQHGRFLHRCAATLSSRGSSNDIPDSEYVVNFYNKSKETGIDRGVVIKLYNTKQSEYSILHVGAAELQKVCDRNEDPDLIKDIVATKKRLDKEEVKVDELEEGLESLTDKGEFGQELQQLSLKLIEYVLDDLCVTNDPMNKTVPTLKSLPRGKQPQ